MILEFHHNGNPIAVAAEYVVAVAHRHGGGARVHCARAREILVFDADERYQDVLERWKVAIDEPMLGPQLLGDDNADG